MADENQDVQQDVQEIDPSQLAALDKHAERLRDADERTEIIASVPNIFMRGSLYIFVGVVIICVAISYFTQVHNIVKAKGLGQISDSGELESMVDAVLAAHPGPVGDLKGGKHRAMAFLVGQIMKASRGKANPKLVNEIIQRKLKEEG